MPTLIVLVVWGFMNGHLQASVNPNAYSSKAACEEDKVVIMEMANKAGYTGVGAACLKVPQEI